MPYGIKNETKEQTEWMEGCVSSISGINKKTGKAYTKSEKIAICKVQLFKKEESEAVSEESIREQYYNLEDKVYNEINNGRGLKSNTYVVDIFDSYIIVEVDSKMYKVNYNISGDDVIINWVGSVEVERITEYKTVEATKGKVMNRVVTYGGNTL